MNIRSLSEITTPSSCNSSGRLPLLIYSVTIYCPAKIPKYLTMFACDNDLKKINVQANHYAITVKFVLPFENFQNLLHSSIF